MQQNQNSPATQHQQVAQLAYLRIFHIIGDKKRGIPPLLPISRSSFLNGIKSGRYPAPIKHGRTLFWRTSDIKQLLETL